MTRMDCYYEPAKHDLSSGLHRANAIAHSAIDYERFDFDVAY